MTIETSIIITCYNTEKYISESIESCLNQIGYQNYEIIIINDGSNDESKKKIESYKQKKIRAFHLKKNCGIEKASNYGIKKSKGKFLLRLDADDVLFNNYLKEVVKILKNKKVEFVYTNYLLIDERKKIINKIRLPKFNKKEIISRGDFLASGTLFKKTVLKKYNYYNTKVKNCGLENYEIILKILFDGNKGYQKNKYLFKHRRHEENISKIKKRSIMRYGHSLFKKLKLKKYKIGKFHPSNV